MSSRIELTCIPVAAAHREQQLSLLRSMSPATRAGSNRARFDVYEPADGDALWVLADAGSLDIAKVVQHEAAGWISRPIETHTLEAIDAVNPANVPDDAYCVFPILVPDPARRASFMALLQDMMRNTRREPGNCRYDLYQSRGGGTLWMLEAYVDEAAVQIHRCSDYYQANVPRIVELLAAPIRVHARLPPGSGARLGQLVNQRKRT